MASWNTLPGEMRLQIWEQLIQPSSDSADHAATPKAGFTNYALVCKEWQAFFETENFARLTIHQDYLDGLGQLSPSRQRLVKHIWLRIELQTYNCSSCIWREGENTAYGNERIVWTAIWELFDILSSRKWVGKSTAGRGLTLELSAHSPSDSKHMFGGIHARSLLPTGQQTIELNDPSHRARFLRADNDDDDDFEYYSRGPVYRLHAPIEVEFYSKLPMVKLIKAFVIRRHARRQFSAEMLRHIFLSLPRLEHMSIESWNVAYVSIGYGLLLKETLPRRVKSLSLFEDHIRDTTVYPKPFQLRLDDSEIHRMRGQVLAKISRKLEKLSVSFIVEANAFFQTACHQARWAWRKLELLTLTSRLLRANENPDAINGMLQAAATVALRMPKLVTTELWNGGRNLAGVFRYSVDRAAGGVATLTWQGTWDLDLQPQLIKAWQDVAYKHIGKREVRVEKHLMRGADIDSHGDALHQLEINRHAINPESLHQIRTEKGFCYFP